jgi:hypothetical protein
MQAIHTGRPSSYTEKVANEIVARLSEGEPLATICRSDVMPHRATVTNWCLGMPDFAAKYALAREIGFDHLAAECLEIADTPLEGTRTRTGKDGTEVIREDMLGHRKLQIDTRLKLLAKWDPKRYGDKLDVNATVAAEIRIVVGGDTE